MNVEIERRFLIEKERFSFPKEKKYIKQSYIFIEDSQVLRVRQIDSTFFLTYKYKKSNIERYEFEYNIPMEDAEKLFLLSKKNAHIIEKTRYYMHIEEHVWEIDEFENNLAGLIIAEVELEDEDATVEIPSWAGMELTYLRGWSNASLARMLTRQ